MWDLLSGTCRGICGSEIQKKGCQNRITFRTAVRAIVFHIYATQQGNPVFRPSLSGCLNTCISLGFKGVLAYNRLFLKLTRSHFRHCEQHQPPLFFLVISLPEHLQAGLLHIWHQRGCHTPTLLKLLEFCRSLEGERFLATFCQKPHFWTRVVLVFVSERNQQWFCRDVRSHSHCSIIRARCWEGKGWLAHDRSLISHRLIS